MSTHEPERASTQPPLEPLPRLADIPTATQGLDRAHVVEAFDAYERQLTWYQSQLRTTQSRAGSNGEPSGHPVRLDALHLIRAAAEFADTLERDAQEAATRQISRAEGEIRQRQGDLQSREAVLDEERQELERQKSEILNAARQEAKEILARTNREGAQALRESEAAGARLLEQSRHQATELTNAARAEVERTLEWARAQADAIIQRGRTGAEQLLSAALHGEHEIGDVVTALVRAAESQVGPRPVASSAPPDSATHPAGPSEDGTEDPDEGPQAG